MSMCISCGLDNPEAVELCPHHASSSSHDWAVANRIMCDFFHRQRVPTRLTSVERETDDTGRVRVIHIVMRDP